jgi:hypothetical protein
VRPSRHKKQFTADAVKRSSHASVGKLYSRIVHQADA